MAPVNLKQLADKVTDAKGELVQAAFKLTNAVNAGADEAEVKQADTELATAALAYAAAFNALHDGLRPRPPGRGRRR